MEVHRYETAKNTGSPVMGASGMGNHTDRVNLSVNKTGYVRPEQPPPELKDGQRTGQTNNGKHNNLMMVKQNNLKSIRPYKRPSALKSRLTELRRFKEQI